MKAPVHSVEGGKLLPFFELKDGRKIYRQIDDQLLGAIERDAQEEMQLSGIIGMLCARVREAEKDRDAAERMADQMGNACETFKAHILETEERLDVAQRGCTTLSAQLEEANKEVLRLRSQLEATDEQYRLHFIESVRGMKANLDQIIKDLGGTP